MEVFFVCSPRRLDSFERSMDDKMKELIEVAQQTVAYKNQQQGNTSSPPHDPSGKKPCFVLDKLVF